MDIYLKDISISADEILDAEWVYGPNGKKYLKARMSVKNDNRHILLTYYFYPKKPYGSYMCLSISYDSAQKFFQVMQRYKKWGYREMLPYIANSWPKLVRALKNGWEKRSYDICSLNKVHDFENPSRPFAWAFCKSLSLMPTPETFENDPEGPDGEELFTALQNLIEEVTAIDKELESDLKWEDKAKIELIRARNGLVAGLLLGGFRAFMGDFPDIVDSLVTSSSEEVITF